MKFQTLVAFSRLLLGITFIFMLKTNTASAWGGRGHSDLCAAATHVVQIEKLRTYLKARAHIMGHLCNIPDTHWKSLKGPEIALGSSSHYVDADMFGGSISDIPLQFAEVEKLFTGKKYVAADGSGEKTMRSAALEFGSAWWRIDQFHRRNIEMAGKIRSATPPGPKERTSESHPYVAAVNDWVTSLGLMGHFVGDLSQPFHNSLDYDGYGAGHGGIHAHYEEVAVSFFGPDLVPRISEAAIKIRKSTSKDKRKKEKNDTEFLSAKTPVERARALSELSLPDIKKIYLADALIAPSTKKDEKGMSIKKEAERKPIKETFKKFEPLVIEHMARSAALLSLFWEEAYIAAGEPDLEVAKSYWFPFKPDFVPLDYLDAPSDKGASVKKSPDSNN